MNLHIYILFHINYNEEKHILTRFMNIAVNVQDAYIPNTNKYMFSIFNVIVDELYLI
jgi:hypothetical protein